jgi:hypothetical protein
MKKPTSRRDFPCILFYVFVFHISRGLDTNRSIVGASSLAFHGPCADVSCSSSYALAMSPYIYLMTHILFIASLSHTRFSTLAHILLFACTTVDHLAGSASDARPGGLAKNGPRPNSLFHSSFVMPCPPSRPFLST